MRDMLTMLAEWQAAKATEEAAVRKRREVEDEMVRALAIRPDLSGTATYDLGKGLSVKVVGRMNRTVNPDLLQELAAEHGLTDHLPMLFRWKAEYNSKAWAAADISITRPLLGAITTKPARLSFEIHHKEQ